ncbi:MAG: DUF1232 domain-containing protein [Terrimicrobiaceae bacterium]
MNDLHRPRMHRASIVRMHGGAGDAICLDKFLDESRSEISVDEIRRLGGLAAQVEAKLATEQARQHHDLQSGVRMLMDYILSGPARDAVDPLPRQLAEAGVAIRYVLEGSDFIPDYLPEIGMTDDARLVARVIERNPELARR